ncbi:MAG TPA: hypothetical protein VFN42_13775, partial [Acetobacteraceae bacterium]|nr:hypothetical protein [Acetobacteraceae bacterium]
MTTSPNPCRGVRFPAEIIEHAVWLYHCFSRALRDAEQRPAWLRRIDASAVLMGTACGRSDAGKVVSSLNSRRVVLGA